MGNFPDPIAIEAHGGDLHRVEIVGALEDLGLDDQPDVPADWRECYSTEALSELLSAMEAEDFDLLGEAIIGANSAVLGEFADSIASDFSSLSASLY